MRNGYWLLILMVQLSSGQQVPARLGQVGLLDEKLNVSVKNYQITADNYLGALLTVANRYKIPMGIEWVRTPSVMGSVRISGKETQVRGVIQAVVQTQPGYGVEVRNGIVHVFAPAQVPDRENFLKLTVRSFEVRNQVVEIAERRLDDIVNATVSPATLQGTGQVKGGTGFSQLVEVGDPRFSLHLEDSAVEDILDALTLASDRGVWVVTFAPTGELMPSGFRQPASPVTSKALPQRAKPYWELLKWGREPY